VLNQMFRALASLNLSQAREALVGILSDRVKAHAMKPNAGLRADAAAIKAMQRQLVQEAVAGSNVDKQLRGLTALTAKYLQVAAKQLAKADVDSELKPVYMQILKITDSVFDLAVTQLAPGTKGPKLFNNLTSDVERAELQLNVLEWIGTLKKAGILTKSLSIPYEALKLK